LITERDIVNVVKEITFQYKNCNTTIKVNNKVISICMMKVNSQGYIIEKNESFITENSIKYILQLLNHYIKEIEGVYEEIIKEENGINDKIVDL
jgi:hypothetical protein